MFSANLRGWKAIVTTIGQHFTRPASNCMPLESKRGIHFATKFSPINVNTQSSKKWCFGACFASSFVIIIKYTSKNCCKNERNYFPFFFFQNANSFDGVTVNVTLAIRWSNELLILSSFFRRLQFLLSFQLSSLYSLFYS